MTDEIRPAPMFTKFSLEDVRQIRNATESGELSVSLETHKQLDRRLNKIYNGEGSNHENE